MNGVITDAKIAHKRKVKVNPIEKHYENKGEQPYIKYGCPVCAAVGNRNISIPYGISNCRLCQVALNWQEPRKGDRICTVRPGIFEEGTVLVIKEVMDIGGKKEYLVQEEKKDGAEGVIFGDDFSVLELETELF